MGLSAQRPAGSIRYTGKPVTNRPVRQSCFGLLNFRSDQGRSFVFLGTWRKKFESPALKTRMVAGFPQKLLTFSAKYGDERVSKSA
jgi:hypothetical protein